MVMSHDHDYNQEKTMTMTTTTTTTMTITAKDDKQIHAAYISSNLLASEFQLLVTFGTYNSSLLSPIRQ